MKDIVALLDDDIIYSKKFVNKSIKSYGKKYIFLSFNNLQNLVDYVKTNYIEALVLNEKYVDIVEEIKVKHYYILNESFKNIKKEGKKTYVYKLQNLMETLKLIDDDITRNKTDDNNNNIVKLITFYMPYAINKKYEKVLEIARVLKEKKRVLLIDLSEFANYKGAVGLSNIIYNYKENSLTEESIRREIVIEKDVDNIKSVTFPEDFNVITNVDLANIVNEIRKLRYDFIFVNADSSYLKCQYIANDSDKIVMLTDKENENIDKFKSYIKFDKIIEYKKIVEFDLSYDNKEYINNFIEEELMLD